MKLNISLIKKIESIVDLSEEFDKLFNDIVNLDSNTVIDDKSITKIYYITQIFIFIRSEHGGLLILFDKVKENTKSENSELSDKLINKLYDLSTFYSMIEHVTNLISNIDFQYKKIAVMFPKYISKNPISIILIIDDIDKNNKYIEIIEQMKISNPENIYKVIKCSEKDLSKKIKVSNLFNIDISIKIEKLPSFYMVNYNKVVELPINYIKDHNSLLELIN